jgi:hypothetical protein
MNFHSDIEVFDRFDIRFGLFEHSRSLLLLPGICATVSVDENTIIRSLQTAILYTNTILSWDNPVFCLLALNLASPIVLVFDLMGLSVGISWILLNSVDGCRLPVDYFMTLEMMSPNGMLRSEPHVTRVPSQAVILIESPVPP